MSEPNTTSTSPANEPREVDAVVVGAGFAGMYMLYKLREQGFSAQLFERGSDVGGTWYWNRYPGARCDAPSMQYSYQFSEELQQEWKWTEKFAAQPEILAYANHVADRFGLRDAMQFHTTVESAVFDDETKRWKISTDRGDRISAQFCVLATGCLSSRNIPKFKGLERFQGEWFHTSNWPKEGADFRGKRVGIVGTGSTGIQAIPVIAEEAEHLTVFQRTAQYSVPSRNTPMDPAYEARIKADYAGFRAANYEKPMAIDLELETGPCNTFDVDDEERRRGFEGAWEVGGMALFFAYQDVAVDRKANQAVSDFIKDKIREIVEDPEVAEGLMPSHIYACKRPCLDTNYFETYNRPHVTLVNCPETGVEEVTERGLRANGQEHALDCIVFATGFDAMTGSILRIEIRGRGGRALREKWAEGPRSYLGLSSEGFPNLFTISGPGSPSVLTNMIPTIEQHVNWIGACMAHMRERGHRIIEATLEAEDPWQIQVQEAANQTLWNACDNWYQGSNISGKPRIFMPYVDWPGYMKKCEEVVENGYEGFALR